MPAKTLFCIAVSKTHADEITNRLQEEGLAESDISALFPYKARQRGLARQNIPEFCCARTGGLFGGGITGLAITGTLAIPDVGLMVASGDIAALICMAAVRTKPGGIANALAGLGVDESTAEIHQGKIHAGSILITVNTREPNEENRVRRLLEETGAEDIATSGEATTSAFSKEENDTFAHHE